MATIQEIKDKSRPGAHAPVGEDCSFLDSEFVGEEKFGSQSILKFKCTKCNVITRLDLDKRDGDKLGVNKAMVFGALASGGGFSNVQEMAAAVDMPCMTQRTYIKHENAVGREFEELCLREMIEAGKEERRHAEKQKQFTPDGRVWIRVIADGMWSKRSYGNKYDARSGVVSIAHIDFNLCDKEIFTTSCFSFFSYCRYLLLGPTQARYCSTACATSTVLSALLTRIKAIQ